MLFDMSPRPAPDLDRRRVDVVRSARALAEEHGWPSVTMRRVAEELSVTQPVLYSAFTGRQDLIEAVALGGFADLADALTAVPAEPRARTLAYLAFSEQQPRTYEAMFVLPSALHFGNEHTPEPLTRAFRGIRDVFPDADDAYAEVVWSTLHGLATLWAGGRLRAHQAQARIDVAVAMFTRPERTR
jgi:AcrR family transcriptional regulator